MTNIYRNNTSIVDNKSISNNKSIIDRNGSDNIKNSDRSLPCDIYCHIKHCYIDIRDALLFLFYFILWSPILTFIIFIILIIDIIFKIGYSSFIIFILYNVFILLFCYIIINILMCIKVSTVLTIKIFFCITDSYTKINNNFWNNNNNNNNNIWKIFNNIKLQKILYTIGLRLVVNNNFIFNSCVCMLSTSVRVLYIFARFCVRMCV
eukprot:GHVR01119100.1.p1 GENE.GHVR01119100.1~~GHVR01119100.1.p1  ORF type:complete len:207 (-),score=50.88 GHVR01119100.1:100-720(-)